MLTNVKTCLAALCLSFVSGAVEAVTVTVGDTDWDVTTIEGSSLDNLALLKSQEWWGDFALAGLFGNAVDDSLGYPNETVGETSGPIFAYQADSLSVSGRTKFLRTGFIGTAVLSRSESYVFAVADRASVVPLPAGLPLLFTGIGGLVLFGARRRCSA